MMTWPDIAFCAVVSAVWLDHVIPTATNAATRIIKAWKSQV